MVDTSIYIVILLAGTVFFFITKLRLTQEAVHKELEQKGQAVTNHAFPSGNMGTDTVSEGLKQVSESVKRATGLNCEQEGRPVTPRTRSRKAD